jgi:hypothetical protein
MSQGTNRTDPVDDAESDDATGGRGDTTRRRLLASGAATWATVALAGCPGNAGDGGDGGDGGTPQDTPTETATPEPQPESYVVTTETWTGGGVPSSIAFMSSCARSDTFVPGMQMVFFVGIFDPETGDRLTSDDLSGVQVNLGDGMETLDMEWTDEHSYATRNEGNNWVAAWDIPEDMDPQSLSYTVEVSNSDASFQNVGVLSDAIEVVEYDDPSNLVVDTETRWNGHPAPEYANGFVGACAPEREFTPELDVTFVVGMYDSTSGNMVGADGLVNPASGEAVEDEGSAYADGLNGATVVSSDGAFDDVPLEWTAALDDENGLPRWFGTLETENLDPGTYGYEIQIDDGSSGRFDTGVASAQFSIIEVPE